MSGLRVAAPGANGAGTLGAGTLGAGTLGIADVSLLECTGPVEDAHVLVIGEALEVMCALIRRGCVAAAEMALQDRVKVDRVDIVVVPRLGDAARAAQAVALARGALAPFGRIVMRDASEPLARVAAALLRTQGFSAIRVRVVGGWTLVTAERPWFGPILVQRASADGPRIVE